MNQQRISKTKNSSSDLSSKLMEQQNRHAMSFAKSQKSCFDALEKEDDSFGFNSRYIVIDGASNSELRETYGHQRGKDIILYPEEALYAYFKGLLGVKVEDCDPKVFVFYETMRNQGKFLTRSPLQLQPNNQENQSSEMKESETKRQKLSDTVQVQNPTILAPDSISFDIYADKASFRAKQSPLQITEIIILALASDIDLCLLQKAQENAKHAPDCSKFRIAIIDQAQVCIIDFNFNEDLKNQND